MEEMVQIMISTLNASSSEGLKINSNFIVNSDTQAVRKSLPNIAIRTNGNFIQHGIRLLMAVIRFLQFY